MTNTAEGQSSLRAESGEDFSRQEEKGGCLPTLQKNALKKIFDRQEFSPEEVAALGYRRLHQAEGIGRKGLQTISDWLRGYGLELRPPDPPVETKVRVPKKAPRSIEQAVRLLRTHGYEVLPSQFSRKGD